MTRKFKRTVRSIVLDGMITPEEKNLLKKVAREENVSESEAEIYITKELKKQKVKLSNGDSWLKKNSNAIITGIFSLGGIVITHILKGEKK